MSTTLQNKPVWILNFLTALQWLIFQSNVNWILFILYRSFPISLSASRVIQHFYTTTRTSCDKSTYGNDVSLQNNSAASKLACLTPQRSILLYTCSNGGNKCIHMHYTSTCELQIVNIHSQFSNHKSRYMYLMISCALCNGVFYCHMNIYLVTSEECVEVMRLHLTLIQCFALNWVHEYLKLYNSVDQSFVCVIYCVRIHQF